VFALSACNQGDGNSEEVAQLRQEVTELRQSNQDTRLKLQLAGHVWGRSPLGDFFAAPEFWENTYDSSGADCARRCQSANGPVRKACAAKPESEREQCYTDAANDLGLCVQRCS
jgi:hypothetical protein